MKKLYYVLILLLSSSYGMAQSITVEGRISDKETGESLIGASIIELGTMNGTTAGADGVFQFTIAEKSSKLQISYLGYKIAEVSAMGNLNVELVSDASSALDEIVVIGYGAVRKSDVTGAVSKVNAKDLAKTPSLDAARALQGKVAGVAVQANSGEPGSGTKIRIRGIGSINNSDPLYVVDGIQVSDISHIAPTNIESIEILKDASATAIYGSRGSNGVVMVKTRGGQRNTAPVVSVNIFASVSAVADQIDMLNASDYALVKSEALNNAGSPISSDWANMFAYVSDNNLVGTNWQDEIFHTALSENYNVDVSGGSDKNTYSIGATYANEEGVVKETFMDKFMANVSNDYRFNDNVRMGVNVYYTHYDKTGNNSDYYTGPLVGALRADPISSAFDPYTNDFGEIYYAYGTNPARAVSENKYKSEVGDNLVVNSYLQFDNIGIKGLSFRAQFGSNMGWRTTRNYAPVFYVTTDQQRQQSSLYEQRNDSSQWTTSEYFTYSNTFGKHFVNATAGFEASQYNYSFANVTAYDVPEDANLRYISASSNSNQYIANGGASENSLASFFARVNYNFDGKYLVTATVRADGSSKFVDKWGYFPSFSMGWNLYNENFITDANTAISVLRIRGGWGQVGNQDAAGNHDYLSTMSNGYNYVFGGQPIDGAIQQKVANSALSWETSEQYNIGVDFGFWENKLTGTADYFVRNTNDMILATPVPMYAGFWRPNTNAGSMSNRGFELSLNHTNTVSDFTYSLGVNFSTINNEVTSIGSGDPIGSGSVPGLGNTTRTEIGHEIAYYYGLQTDGVFNSQAELDAYVNKDGDPIQPYAEPGDVKFVDANGDGRIEETTDRVKLGSAIPNFTLGFNASLAYKSFDFNVDIQGVFGNEIVNGMYQTLYSTDMSEWSVCKDMLNRWTPDNSASNIPRVHAADPNKNSKFSDLYVEDGSYVRISNIQLGYTLPESVSMKIKLQQLRFYVSVNNPFTFTDYTGFDPEVAGSNLSSGVDIANYPIPRTFSVGCNLKF